MNILAVGAHFDDIELGCSGALAKHVKNGDQVTIYVATDSEYSNGERRLIRSGKIAKAEGERAASIIGAELICGKCNSLFLEFVEEINVELIKIIEERKIDIVYTHWLGDVQHDHSNLSKATLHAARHIPKILMYRSNWYISNDSFRENYFVDITETWETKEKAILAHQSELGRVGTKWIDYFKRQASNNGLVVGVEYAEGFEVVKWLA